MSREAETDPTCPAFAFAMGEQVPPQARVQTMRRFTPQSVILPVAIL